MTMVVNGRFLRVAPTGMHRVARELLDAGIEAGLQTEVLAPVGVDDPRVDRTLWAPGGRAGDHLWEQVVLPVAARRRPVLSLTNTGPLAASRSVVMVHDFAPVVGPQWYRKQMRAYARLVTAVARRADIVITPSRQVADEVVAIGIPSARVHPVRPPIERLFEPAAEDRVSAVRERYGLGRQYALFVGWADPRKNAALAVAAHAEVVDGQPHDLVLAGRLHPVFAPVSLPRVPTVRQVGYVSDDDLRALMTGAAVFLFPSLYEGFGLPPVEALACGTPALVSDLPAVRESTAGCAEYLPVGDVAVWASALRRALAGELEARRPPAWGRSDAGALLLDALDAAPVRLR